jgi:trehalose 6-phosphate phosphatase
MDAPHWTECTTQLAALATLPRLGILADFDGTLAHFTLDPMTTPVDPANATAIDRLHEAGVTIALISGRPVVSLRDRFPRPFITYHGSHGLDYWEGNEARLHDLARPWEAPFQALLSELGTLPYTGIHIENKRGTGSVHYRQTPDPTAIRGDLYDRLKPLAEKYGFNLSEGRWIWEIKPPIPVNKGTSVRTLVDRLGLEGAIFLGDDITDLSAFQAMRDLAATRRIQSLVIGVKQPDGGPQEVREGADMLATNPDDVANVLNALADYRTGVKY